MHYEIEREKLTSAFGQGTAVFGQEMVMFHLTIKGMHIKKN